MEDTYFPKKVIDFLGILDDSNFRKQFPGIPKENAVEIMKNFKNLLIFYHHGYIYDQHFYDDEELFLKPFRDLSRHLPDDGEITSYILIYSINSFRSLMRKGLIYNRYDTVEIERQLVIFERCIIAISDIFDANKGNLL